MQLKIRAFLGDSNILILEGLKHVLSADDQIEIVGCATKGEEMIQEVLSTRPDVLLVDYTSDEIRPYDLLEVMKQFPSIRIVGISHDCHVDTIKKLVSKGLNGHLMTDCDRQEILDSVKASARGDKFFCGKVLDQLNASEGEETDHGCDPVNISQRELEILQLIADGLTTKQIAKDLHLSFHTVMTHRKNMMAKLGLNNTAGLIVYAVRENLITPNKYLFSA